MSELYEEIVRLQRAGEPCALCTITKTVGSTPGKTTMKMLVRRDGSFEGTVGGGCLEAEVLEAALAAMGDERSRTLSFALNERDYPDSGLLCGGQLEIFVEPIVVPRLVLFGGGHVAGAIGKLAHMIGFHVTVADDRAEFAARERHPDADAHVCGEFGELAARFAPGEDLYVVAVTRGHDKDGEVLEALAREGARPKYLGMIGSRAKKVQLFEALRARGVSEAFLERVRTPMGLPIGARTHEEIAVAVAAELVSFRRLGGPPAAASGTAAARSAGASVGTGVG
ncbi:MAG: xanthine dehydrogenase, partial [Planctomycetes bacterium]|nr:xanthine dehydrogenase [Planctomycetota bacterium]